MEMQDYELAKSIRENINHMNVKKLQVEKMKKRDNDDEFNLLCELAYDGIHYAISRLEADFRAI